MVYNLGQTKVIRIFFEEPVKPFHIREIARKLKLSKTTVAHHVNNLLKERIIIAKKNVFKEYYANESNTKYRQYKFLDGLRRIFESGLIEELEMLNPICIILFGSFAKAEYDSKSDIDIFLQCKEEDINLYSYEKKLGHKLHLLFEPDINKISPELLNNLINGITLSGYLKIK